MTDQFEARLAKVLRSDAEDAVRPIDAGELAVAAIATSAGARRLSPWPSGPTVGPGRWSPQMLVTGALLAMAAIAGVAVASGAVRVPSLLDEDPTLAVVVAPPVASPAASPPVDARPPVPIGGATTWTADVEAVPAIDMAAGRAHLIVGYGGSSALVETADRHNKVASTIVAGPTDELRLSLVRDGGGCRAGDIGRYRLVLAPDRSSLSLTLIDDPCASRAELLARPWRRTLFRDSEGGSGLVDAFEPAFLMTIPSAPTVGVVEGPFVEISSEGFGFDIVKDPVGVSEPCTETGGEPLPGRSRAATIEAYLRSIPGVVVSSTPTAVGGFPARHLHLETPDGPNCDDGSTLGTPRIKLVPTTSPEHIVRGYVDFYVVDLPDATVLLSVDVANVAGFDEQSVLSSIRFEP